MSTPATYYTKLYPKRGDLTGSSEQAYNLLPTKYFDHILGGIGAGTIAALGTVAPGSYNLSYIYAPQVHTEQTSAVTSFALLETHPTKLVNSAASTSTKMLLDSSGSLIPT
jgi:hypothetical protein